MKYANSHSQPSNVLRVAIVLCCLLHFLFCNNSLFGQGVSINDNGTTADPSAIIDISSTTQGQLIPRMTEAQRNAIVNPAIGLQIFNLTTNCFNFWMGTAWKQICGDCDFNSPIAGNNGPVCEGFNLNLTATSIAGATFQWSGPNGFTSTQQNPVLTNVTSASSGSYFVTATKNGCTCQQQSTVAIVNATPATPIASNDGPKCVGTALTLSASAVAGATSYNWSGPNGYSATGQNPVISDIQTNTAGTYSVTTTVNGCVSAYGSTSVTVLSIPATPGTISGNNPACANSAGNVYSIVPVPGATSYNWTVPAGGSITVNNGNSVTITFGSSLGNITVTATNVCGTSAARSVTIAKAPVNATGGIITYTDASGLNPRSSPAYPGGYTVHTFTSSGTFTVSCPGNVEALVVAGGGSGGAGSYSGGGGAGGVLYSSGLAVNVQAYTVTVGAGGTNSNGQNSLFSTFLTAIGGGKGGQSQQLGSDGGSGGGGGYNCSPGYLGGNGTSGQGYAGGRGNSTCGYGWGGGGGGAGGTGANALHLGSPGNGGIGVAYSISGVSSYYGGGGGGGIDTQYYRSYGGNGGGGWCLDLNQTGTNGTANTGGGGGGVGGLGGSGIVIIRYPN